MKKQILLLAVFTLAMLFAGTSKVFGQLGPSTTPEPIPPLSCISSSEPLHPFPGIPYVYSLKGIDGEEVAASYTWWATKDVSFVSGIVDVAGGMTGTNFDGRLTTAGGDELLEVGATYGVTTDASVTGADSVSITWSSALLAGTTYQGDGVAPNGTPTFVVGYSEGENCADNIQVYEINPKPNFTIDIAAVDMDADTTLKWDVADSVCVDVVHSATYNTGSHEIDVDYGENILYFEVSASNFVTDWTPTFTLDQTNYPGLQGTQTALLELYSSLANAQAGTGAITSNSGSEWTAAGGTWATGQQLTADDPLNVSSGVSVFVKVTITNNTWESLTSSPFVLAVDAQDDGGSGIWDMEDADCGEIDDNADMVDQAVVVVLPRPQLDHNTTDGGEPEPTNRVPKVDGDGTEYPRF